MITRRTKQLGLQVLGGGALAGLMIAICAMSPDSSTVARPFGKVAVIGASASAGFGLPNIMDAGRADLAKMLDEAILVDGIDVRSFASEFFFVSAKMQAQQQLNEALPYEPTLVVALDYLFWFVYGVLPENSRMSLFEQGLTSLENFDCPIVVGSIPDMSPAIGLMLMKAQVPTPEILEQANARLLEWAGQHENVYLAPMKDMVEQLQQGQMIRVRGIEWDVANKDPALLQGDHLHPTAEGLAMLGLMTLATLAEQHKAFDGSNVEWDARKVALPYQEPKIIISGSVESTDDSSDS